MNKIEVLTEIRRKIDILTELIDSSGEFEPRGISAAGNILRNIPAFISRGGHILFSWEWSDIYIGTPMKKNI